MQFEFQLVIVYTNIREFQVVMGSHATCSVYQCLIVSLSLSTPRRHTEHFERGQVCFVVVIWTICALVSRSCKYQLENPNSIRRPPYLMSSQKLQHSSGRTTQLWRLLYTASSAVSLQANDSFRLGSNS